MTKFLVAPTEPLILKALGTVSFAPERYGSDVIWPDQGLAGICGVQRKEYTDLLSSVTDGRLGKEIEQLQQCAARFLVVEGRPHWSTEGALVHKWLGRWKREDYRSLLRSVQTRGVTVEFSDDEADTVALVESIAKWVAKGEHRSLATRPKPGPDRWGQKTARGFQSHFLQGLDGIGSKQAEAILDHFGGMPLYWNATEGDLRAVKGLGPKRVAAMLKAIPCQKIVESV